MVTIIYGVYLSFRDSNNYPDQRLQEDELYFSEGAAETRAHQMNEKHGYTESGYSYYHVMDLEVR